MYFLVYFYIQTSEIKEFYFVIQDRNSDSIYFFGISAHLRPPPPAIILLISIINVSVHMYFLFIC